MCSTDTEILAASSGVLSRLPRQIRLILTLAKAHNLDEILHLPHDAPFESVGDCVLVHANAKVYNFPADVWAEVEIDHLVRRLWMIRRCFRIFPHGELFWYPQYGTIDRALIERCVERARSAISDEH